MTKIKTKRKARFKKSTSGSKYGIFKDTVVSVQTTPMQRTKLTLTVNKANLHKIKKVAVTHKTSVSSMFDEFIVSVINANEQDRVHPIISRISGIVTDPGNDPDLIERTRRK